MAMRGRLRRNLLPTTTSGVVIVGWNLMSMNAVLSFEMSLQGTEVFILLIEVS